MKVVSLPFHLFFKAKHLLLLATEKRYLGLVSHSFCVIEIEALGSRGWGEGRDPTARLSGKPGVKVRKVKRAGSDSAGFIRCNHTWTPHLHSAFPAQGGTGDARRNPMAYKAELVDNGLQKENSSVVKPPWSSSYIWIRGERLESGTGSGHTFIMCFQGWSEFKLCLSYQKQWPSLV